MSKIDRKRAAEEAHRREIRQERRDANRQAQRIADHVTTRRDVDVAHDPEPWLNDAGRSDVDW